MASILKTYFTSLKGKNVVVLGLGVSNRPLVRLLLRYGCTVTGCDKTPREKLDEELLELNAKEGYYQRVREDIEAFKQEKKVLLKTDVADSNDIRYVDDDKAGSTEVDKLAYVKASYFVRTDKNFSNTYQEFVLREDATGKWKIVAFYEIEGESSDDE